MSEIRKQGISNTLISFLGVGLGYIYTGLLGPYILTTSQIGLTSTLMAVALITSHVAKLGGPYIVIRYFPIFKTDKEKQGFLNFLLLLTTAGFLFFMVAYLWLQPWIISIFKVRSAMFSDYNLWAIPMVFFMSFFELFQAYSRAILRTVFPAILREVVWRLLVIAALLAYYYKLINFDAFVWIYALGYALPLLATVLYLSFIKEMPVGRHFGLNGRSREFLKYGQFVFIGSVASVTLNEIDKVMISLLSIGGLSDTGIYQVSAIFTAVIQIPARSVMMIAAPLVAVFLSNNEMDKVERVYKKSSINQLIAGLYIFVGIYINLDNIFHILPPAYAAGRYVIILISLSKLFDAATGINGEIIINSKYFRWDLYFNLALVAMVVGGDYFIIPAYGINGAAVVSATAIFSYNAIKSWFLYQKFKIQPFSWHTIGVIAIAVACTLLAGLLPVLPNVFVDVFYRSALMTGLFGLLTVVSKASEDINHVVFKWWRKITAQGF